jgi:hypothetical protein
LERADASRFPDQKLGMIQTIVIGWAVAALLVLAWVMSLGRASSLADRAASGQFQGLLMRIVLWGRRRRQRRRAERRSHQAVFHDERRRGERRAAERRSDPTIFDG